MMHPLQIIPEKSFAIIMIAYFVLLVIEFIVQSSSFCKLVLLLTENEEKIEKCEFATNDASAFFARISINNESKRQKEAEFIT